MIENFKDIHVIDTIDIHGLKVWEATVYLNNYISQLPKDTKELVVIHGYNSGKALSNLVRKEFVHSRIKRRILSLNPGKTSLILK